MRLIINKCEQNINDGICTIEYKINVKNIDNTMVLDNLILVYSFINSVANSINFRKYVNILKKNKKSMELFLNLCVLLMYRAFKAIKFTFQNKDMINMDKLKFIPYDTLFKFILKLCNLLNNEFIGNTCSYNDYFMKSREVGIWMNFN